MSGVSSVASSAAALKLSTSASRAPKNDTEVAQSRQVSTSTSRGGTSKIIDVGDLPDGIIDVGDLPDGIIDVGDLPDGVRGFDAKA